MPDFQWVKTPYYSPTLCTGCNTHSHPRGFVDLLADDVSARVQTANGPSAVVVHGRFYLCAGCVEAAGQKVKMLSEKQADDLTDRVTAAQETIANLEQALNRERDNKVVSLSDARKLFSGTVSAPVTADSEDRSVKGRHVFSGKPAA